MTPVLEIRNLTTEFATGEGRLVAVDGVSISVPEGGTVGIVGESGCGKTVSALSVMRLVSSPAGRIASGEVLFRGQDLLALPEAQMRRMRGNKISMIFQEPMTSLNPVFTVGAQISEVVRLHQGLGRRAARARAIEMLHKVGIPSPEERVDSFPHQLSGGMRQRVLIAMALSCNPDVLIADEPTSALDVTVQAQILDLIRRLQAERRMAVLLISHDLGVVAELCDEVTVMYAGKVVERGSVGQVFAKPRHPYTAALLRSQPTADSAGGAPVPRRRLHAIAGMVPDLRNLPAGCRFRDRCERAIAECTASHPALVKRQDAAGGGSREVACYNPIES